MSVNEDVGVTEEADLRSATLQGGVSMSSSINNICWVNIRGEEEGKYDLDEVNGNVKMNLSQKDLNHVANGMGLVGVPSGLAGTVGGPTYKKRRNCCSAALHKLGSMISWIFSDFRMRHLIWIKLVFLFQSASMTVLYPYINLHMKSLGISVEEMGIINAVIPILFIFTPPLAGFMADRIGNFRILLSILTASGGLVSLLLLLVPIGRDVSTYPEQLTWGLTCGAPGSRSQYQNLMVHGFNDDKCEVRPDSWTNATFESSTCGYMCPTRSRIRVTPKFFEYKVVWPNRDRFGITEIVDVVNLDSIDAREYHEPRIIDNSIFFPMNWTFHLSCDRIRPDDCVFNPVKRGPSHDQYKVQLSPMQITMKKSTDHNHPEFVVNSILPPNAKRSVSRTINCGSKADIAQVVSTVETSVLGGARAAPTRSSVTQLIDTKLNDCVLTCLVYFPRTNMCNNTQVAVDFDPSLTFWSYLLVRTVLGVLTAASLMMFEGAVMATIQESGGDYGLQRFVGNFGAIVFAPLGGYLIDTTSVNTPKTDFSSVFYIYLVLKLLASFLILFIRLDFKPPGERILSNVGEIVRNIEVVMFLIMMMFAGSFWGYIEGFLFWFLDDLGASKLMMGGTLAIGMVTSLPFLVFSGPITDILGHINVIILGMIAYFVRLLGYSYLQDPVYVFLYEGLEGFTMALMMTSAVTYVAKISTPTTIASVMGLMGSLFFGIGKGSGSLFGGLLMGWIGSRWTFRWFSANALLCSTVYIVFKMCRGKRKMEEKEEADKSVEKDEEVGEGDPDESVEDKNISLGPRSLNGGTRV